MLMRVISKTVPPKNYLWFQNNAHACPKIARTHSKRCLFIVRFKNTLELDLVLSKPSNFNKVVFQNNFCLSTKSSFEAFLFVYFLYKNYLLSQNNAHARTRNNAHILKITRRYVMLNYHHYLY